MSQSIIEIKPYITKLSQSLTLVVLRELVRQDVDVVANVFRVDFAFFLVVPSFLFLVNFALRSVILPIRLRVFVISFHGRFDQLRMRKEVVRDLDLISIL